MRLLDSLHLVIIITLAAVSLALAHVDRRCRRLPNRLVLAFACLALVDFAICCPWTWPDLTHAALTRVTMAFTFVLPLFGLSYLSYRAHTLWLGMGDVKLIGALTLWLGDGVCVAFCLAVLSLLIVTVGKCLKHNRPKRHERVAFGPSLLIGAWLTLAATTCHLL